MAAERRAKHFNVGSLLAQPSKGLSSICDSRKEFSVSDPGLVVFRMQLDDIVPHFDTFFYLSFSLKLFLQDGQWLHIASEHSVLTQLIR